MACGIQGWRKALPNRPCGAPWIRNATGYVLVWMEADLSHPPEAITAMLAKLAEGADFVIGSRYTRGGGVEDWGLFRRFVSRGGSTFARIILGLAPHDLTGGFKCFRRAVLEAIDLDSVTSMGYAFQIEMAFRMVRAGFRVTEVPIHFTDRRVGKSKMDGKVAREALLLVPRLRGRVPR